MSGVGPKISWIGLGDAGSSLLSMQDGGAARTRWTAEPPACSRAEAPGAGSGDPAPRHDMTHTCNNMCIYIYIVFPRTRTHHNPDQQMFDSALQQLLCLHLCALLANRRRLGGSTACRATKTKTWTEHGKMELSKIPLRQSRYGCSTLLQKLHVAVRRSS